MMAGRRSCVALLLATTRLGGAVSNTGDAMPLSGLRTDRLRSDVWNSVRWCLNQSADAACGPAARGRTLFSSDLCEPILPACPEKKVCTQVGKLPSRLRTKPA